MARTPNLSDVKTRPFVMGNGDIPTMGNGKGLACYRVADCYYSYSTCICVVDHANRRIIFNTTPFSTTTNRWMWMLQLDLPETLAGYTRVDVQALFNATRDDLLLLADGVIESAGYPADELTDVDRRMARINGYGQVIGRMPNRSTLI